MAPFALPRAKPIRFDSEVTLGEEDDGFETEKPKKESRWRFLKREIAEDEKKAMDEPEEMQWQIPAVAAALNLESRRQRKSKFPYVGPHTQVGVGNIHRVTLQC
jgi:hypothetical protein